LITVCNILDGSGDIDYSIKSGIVKSSLHGSAADGKILRRRRPREEIESTVGTKDEYDRKSKSTAVRAESQSKAGKEEYRWKVRGTELRLDTPCARKYSTTGDERYSRKVSGTASRSELPSTVGKKKKYDWKWKSPTLP
jgi:hypothetical protein